MTEFEVWAPDAENVALQLAGRRLRMQARDDGYWVMEAVASAGDDYGFIVDDGDPLPDPRSPWQPHGVHGLSRLVDHAAFRWSDEGWSAPSLDSALIYELHVGTFTPEGTFEAAIAKLDYLEALGVTHVQLMPVADFAGEHGWGYDGVSLYAPKHSYGGPKGLKKLVDACHRKGLAVLLDVVYNHLGPDGNYLGKFGPYFTDRYSTPWGEAVNLDGAGSNEVRRFFVDNALMWLRDYHVDGLRLDATDELYDRSALHFLEQLAREVDALAQQLRRPLVLIAENDVNDPRLLRRWKLGGYGLHAQWLDDFHHALHAVLTGEQGGYYVDFGRMADLAATLTGAYVYAGRYSVYRDHRRGRRPSVIPGGMDGQLLPGARFVAFMQNHDQVGNRAVGDRIGHLVDEARVKVGAALLLTAPFVPLLFQGEEWAASSPFLYFTDHQDPQLVEAVREGRQNEFRAFGWDPEEVPDPQNPATFQRTKLDWSERDRGAHGSVLNWYRRLIRLRGEHPALQDHELDSVELDFDDNANWLVVYRGTLSVVCNLNDKPREVRVREHIKRVEMVSGANIEATEDTVRLNGAGVIILTLDNEQ